MPTTAQDVCGAPDPHTVEWKYLKYFGQKKKKSQKDSIVRRATTSSAIKEDAVNEVVDMNKQRLPENWVKAKHLWNQLVERGLVYPTDSEGLLTFEKFYSAFMTKNKREPDMPDIVRGFLNGDK